jgi:hypothetical protein
MANIQNKFVNYRYQAKEAYISYLNSIPWDFFITGSTRYDLTLKSARRLVNRWYDQIRLLNQTCLFWVAEPFELKDGHHIHGLLKMPDCSKQYFDLMINTWQWATGNKDFLKEKWNALHMVNYKPRLGASGYCSKYLLKDHNDYDLLI